MYVDVYLLEMLNSCPARSVVPSKSFVYLQLCVVYILRIVMFALVCLQVYFLELHGALDKSFVISFSTEFLNVRIIF